MRPRSSGPSLQAQPAPWEYCVRRAACAEVDSMTKRYSRGLVPALPVFLHDRVLKTVASGHPIPDLRLYISCSIQERRGFFG